MPPIFGILPPDIKPIDPEMVRRMQYTATYIKPRRVETLEIGGVFMAAAVVHENPLVIRKDALVINGQWAIVADTVLFKRRELLKRLGRNGEEGIGRDEDTALILEAWLKWGKECMQYLYGDFAFAIFNRQTGEIFCGRDPLGVRPFFYCIYKGYFIFGSELRYIKACFDHQPSLRWEYLLETLTTGRSQKHLTPFEDIQRLKPGHYMFHGGKQAGVYAYWQVYPDRQIRLQHKDEYIAVVREKIIQSVKMRCTGVTRLGAELSGGLDSSAVTGIAVDFANATKASFTAFSNIYPAGTGTEFRDEQEFISAMRTFKSFNWVGVDRLNQSIPELLQHTIDIQGCYIQQNFNIFNRGIYESAGKQGVQVLLSGFGGDELVSSRIAMPWNEIIDERQWKELFDELFYKKGFIKALLKLALVTAKYIKSRLHHPEFRTGAFSPGLLDERFASLPLQALFAERHALKKRYGEKYRMAWRKSLSWRQYDRVMQDHLPQRMEYCYSAAAQYGVEYRYPLLDVDLVETFLAFPPWIKQHHGINRYIFRQAIKGCVPEAIWQRDDKSGTTIPHMHYSLINEKDLLLDLVNSCSGSPFLNEVFDLTRFSIWYERLVKRDKADMNYLMPGAFYNYLMILLYYRNAQ